jgi:sugar phosphate isomerase/epimerase
MKNTTRRDFIKKTSLAAGLLPLSSLTNDLFGMDGNEDNLSVHIFSKHLQFLEYKALGEQVAEMGFAGVDLTVRPKGHVLPENVNSDLVKAINAIKSGGSHCTLMTTTVEDVNNSMDREVLQAAAESGVRHYRANWFKYPKGLSMEEALDRYGKQLKRLGKLNKKLNLIGCYQNHSGTSIGASIWEIKELLETVNPNYFGAQYDIRHAVVEGARSWENGLKLIRNQIKTIVLKDFKWGQVDGKVKLINTPIGEGMVDFKKYFKLLKAYKINVPVSLHLEYPIGGAEHGARTISVDQKVVFDAMTKDLNAIQKLWKEA